MTVGCVHATNVEEKHVHNLIEGTLLIGYHIASVLFDARVIYSYISSQFEVYITDKFSRC